MAFNLNDYETVESRLVKFWKEYPDGRVFTELLESNQNRFVVMASVYRTEADAKPWATGHASEDVTERGVNSTSALENCETSAIGRALANAGYATHGKRPSREEMVKVARRENDSVIDRVAKAEESWESFVTGKRPEPTELGQATDNVLANLKETLGAKEVISCKHGPREERTGVGKNGKPWMGYFCSGNGTQGHKCPVIWATYVEQTGTFRVPDESE